MIDIEVEHEKAVGVKLKGGQLSVCLCVCLTDLVLSPDCAVGVFGSGQQLSVPLAVCQDA